MTQPEGSRRDVIPRDRRHRGSYRDIADRAAAQGRGGPGFLASQDQPSRIDSLRSRRDSNVEYWKQFWQELMERHPANRNVAAPPGPRAIDGGSATISDSWYLCVRPQTESACCPGAMGGVGGGLQGKDRALDGWSDPGIGPVGIRPQAAVVSFSRRGDLDDPDERIEMID